MERLPRLLALIAAGLLAFQVELASLARLAPTDVFIALTILVGGLTIRYRPGSIVVAAVMFPVALVMMLAPVVARGHVPTIHTLAVKVTGAVVLAVSYLVWQHYFRDDDDRRRVFTWFLVGGMSVSAAGLLTWFGLSYPLSDVLFFERARYVGGLVDPNNFGAFMATVLVFCVLCFPYPFRSRAIATANIAAAAAFLAASTSRGAWIGAVVSLFGSLVIFGRLRLRHGWAAAAAAALAAATGLVAAAVEEFEGRPDNVGDRLNQFDIGIGQALQSPLTGIGLGEFQLYHDGIIHNSLIWLWVEGGIVGVVLFLGFAFSPIRHVFDSLGAATAEEARVLQALFGAHVCMLVVSMGIEATYQRYWWFYLAMLTSLVAQVHARSAHHDDEGAGIGAAVREKIRR